LTFDLNPSAMNYMASPSKHNHPWLAGKVGAASGCLNLLDK
jgi:hypothetical protein